MRLSPITGSVAFLAVAVTAPALGMPSCGDRSVSTVCVPAGGGACVAEDVDAALLSVEFGQKWYAASVPAAAMATTLASTAAPVIRRGVSRWVGSSSG